MKLLRTIIALFYGVLTFIGIGFIGASVLSDYRGIIGIIIGSAILLFGIYAAYKVYRLTVRRGVMEILAQGTSGSDLDNPMATNETNFREITPSVLSENFKTGNNKFESGRLRIWGDWQGRKLDEKQTAQRIEYDEHLEMLEIFFSSYCRLQIFKPSQIFEANSYLKILKAKKIVWKTYTSEKEFLYEYERTESNVAFKTNSDWKMDKYDISLREAALFIT